MDEIDDNNKRIIEDITSGVDTSLSFYKDRMTPEYKKGLIKSIGFYESGFLLAYIIYLVFGWEYRHAPGFHHIIILLTMLIGFLWLLFTLISYFSKSKSKEKIAIILVNSLATVGFLVFTLSLVKEDNKGSKIKEDKIIAEVKGDTVSIFHSGNLIYYKIKDSVYIDLSGNAPLNLKAQIDDLVDKKIE